MSSTAGAASPLAGASPLVAPHPPGPQPDEPHPDDPQEEPHELPQLDVHAEPQEEPHELPQLDVHGELQDDSQHDVVHEDAHELTTGAQLLVQQLTTGAQLLEQLRTTRPHDDPQEL